MGYGQGHGHSDPGAAVTTGAGPEPTARGAATPRAVLGLDTSAPDLRAADSLLLGLARLPADTVGCTHLIRGEHAHVAVTVEVAAEDAARVWGLLRAAADAAAPRGGAAWGHRRYGAAPAAEAAGCAAAAQLLGNGRAVIFPGAAGLSGTVTVRELLSRSAIRRVRVPGGGAAGDSAPVVTRGHVRPERRGGELVLALAHTAGGRLAPLEVPYAC